MICISFFLSVSCIVSIRVSILSRALQESKENVTFSIVFPWIPSVNFPNHSTQHISYHCLKVSPIHISLTMLSPSSFYFPSFIVLGHTKQKAYQAHSHYEAMSMCLSTQKTNYIEMFRFHQFCGYMTINQLYLVYPKIKVSNLKPYEIITLQFDNL